MPFGRGLQTGGGTARVTGPGPARLPGRSSRALSGRRRARPQLHLVPIPLNRVTPALERTIPGTAEGRQREANTGQTWQRFHLSMPSCARVWGFAISRTFRAGCQNVYSLSKFFSAFGVDKSDFKLVAGRSELQLHMLLCLESELRAKEKQPQFSFQG